MQIKIKRAYEAPDEEDGQRILVDRLWPRGISKERARIDFWPKELAPSTELRRWYDHSPEKWPVFKARYFEELETKPVLMKELLDRLHRGTVTFVYSSKERRLNNAVAIRDYIDSITR
ncbi:MAG: uroporphyrin-III methyltransferase [Deltaproteobacteria bacterium SG8_13]|nr:MAG: uroporphyrin-III methyltransferase [Deltaproteobacteria bacterium SG8_13]